jgi:prepilin-type N-terminal cleavage/methylation domain-containing protein/prepilin-type processing-associated H-X9-DG protein
MESTRLGGGKNRGFTLVELLVVIGVIALLISILIPALNKARRSANSAACLSNIRQWTTSWQMYCQDNRGRSLDYHYVVGERLWIARLAKYIPPRMDKVRLCPEAIQPIRTPAMGSDSPADVFRAWFVDTHAGSYGFNGFRYFDHNKVVSLLYPTVSFDKPSEAIPLSTSRYSSEGVVFSDAVWIDFWGRNSQAPSTNESDYSFPSTGTYVGIHRTAVDRHGKSINVAFGDGSARRIVIPELWTLRWNGSDKDPGRPDYRSKVPGQFR